MGAPASAARQASQDGYAILARIEAAHPGWTPYRDPETGMWTARSALIPPVNAGTLPDLLAALDEVNR